MKKLNNCCEIVFKILCSTDVIFYGLKLKIRQYVEISRFNIQDILVKKLKMYEYIKKFRDLLDTGDFLIYNDLV